MTVADSQTIIVAETGKSKYQVEARMGDATLIMDEPISAGGLGSGPNPYDLLSAALGACTTMTVRLYAAHKGWPLNQVRVAVRHSRASLNSKDSFALDIALEGPLEASQRARLLEIADRCPVHLTLARGSDVSTVLLPDAKVQPVESPAHMQCMVEACAD
jgi:putative redox protein